MNNDNVTVKTIPNCHCVCDSMHIYIKKLFFLFPETLQYTGNDSKAKKKVPITK